MKFFGTLNSLLGRPTQDGDAAEEANDVRNPASCFSKCANNLPLLQAP